MVDGSKGKWTKLVADFESSDLSQREFANERGVPLSNLRYLLYRLRKESRPLVTEGAEQESAAQEPEAPKEGSRLVPVEVVVAAAPESLLELALPSGTRLRFPAGTDLAYLLALAAAL